MTKVKGRLLYLLDGNSGLLFLRMSFFLVDLSTGEKVLVCSMPVGKVITLISQSLILSRLMRLEPKCVGRLSKTEFIVSLLRSIWVVDVEKKTINKLCDNPNGFSEVINFCSTKNGVYWGDYGRNPEYCSVNVYHLDKNRNIKVIYTFPKGSIRHIHNIINYSDGFVVLTGDNESHAGIYQVNANWSSIKPWKIGEQKYRAVVCFPNKDGLLYATDSVETENHLRMIETDGTERIIAAINGSCIYGGETKDYYFFSTTVEPHEGGGIRKMLSNQLGGGIKSRDVHILAVSKRDLSIRIIKQYKKDFWPMKLFQYGRVPFASGQLEATDGVWCYPIACVGTKGRSEYIKF